MIRQTYWILNGKLGSKLKVSKGMLEAHISYTPLLTMITIRLAYYTQTYDSQLSMSFHVPPLIRSDETSLDLPASTILWRAKSASAWRDIHLAQKANTTSKSHVLSASVHSAHEMLEAQESIDLAFSVDIALSHFWKVIWDARQLHAATKQQKDQPATISLLSGHWQHEMSQTLRNFRMIVGEAQVLSPATSMLHEHLLLNVYVSFEELSLFAGKEGHQDARRVFPSLKQWAESRDSRQALWHAGQVLREATTFAPTTLQDFYAISLYHAGLTLWAYGLLTKGLHRVPKQTNTNPTQTRRESTYEGNEVVFLDGMETAETQKFIALNRAMPAVRRRHMSPTGQDGDDKVFLDDPKAVMETVISVLQENHGVDCGWAVPPLVENLVGLMRDLGRVASKVMRKYQ